MTLPPVRHTTMRLPMEKENCEDQWGESHALPLFAFRRLLAACQQWVVNFTKSALTLGPKIRSGSRLFFPCSAYSFFICLGYALI